MSSFRTGRANQSAGLSSTDRYRHDESLEFHKAEGLHHLVDEENELRAIARRGILQQQRRKVDNVTDDSNFSSALPPQASSLSDHRSNDMSGEAKHRNTHKQRDAPVSNNNVAVGDVRAPTAQSYIEDDEDGYGDIDTAYRKVKEATSRSKKTSNSLPPERNRPLSANKRLVKNEDDTARYNDGDTYDDDDDGNFDTDRVNFSSAGTKDRSRKRKIPRSREFLDDDDDDNDDGRNDYDESNARRSKMSVAMEDSRANKRKKNDEERAVQSSRKSTKISRNETLDDDLAADDIVFPTDYSDNEERSHPESAIDKRRRRRKKLPQHRRSPSRNDERQIRYNRADNDNDSDNDDYSSSDEERSNRADRKPFADKKKRQQQSHRSGKLNDSSANRRDKGGSETKREDAMIRDDYEHEEDSEAKLKRLLLLQNLWQSSRANANAFDMKTNDEPEVQLLLDDTQSLNNTWSLLTYLDIDKILVQFDKTFKPSTRMKVQIVNNVCNILSILRDIRRFARKHGIDVHLRRTEASVKMLRRAVERKNMLERDLVLETRIIRQRVAGVSYYGVTSDGATDSVAVKRENIAAHAEISQKKRQRQQRGSEKHIDGGGDDHRDRAIETIDATAATVMDGRDGAADDAEEAEDDIAGNDRADDGGAEDSTSLVRTIVSTDRARRNGDDHARSNAAAVARDDEETFVATEETEDGDCDDDDTDLDLPDDALFENRECTADANTMIAVMDELMKLVKLLDSFVKIFISTLHQARGSLVAAQALQQTGFATVNHRSTERYDDYLTTKLRYIGERKKSKKNESGDKSENKVKDEKAVKGSFLCTIERCTPEKFKYEVTLDKSGTMSRICKRFAHKEFFPGLLEANVELPKVFFNISNIKKPATWNVLTVDSDLVAAAEAAVPIVQLGVVDMYSAEWVLDKERVQMKGYCGLYLTNSNEKM